MIWYTEKNSSILKTTAKNESTLEFWLRQCFWKTGFWFYFFPLESVIEVENLKKDVISVEESYFVIVNKQTIEFQDELNM
jgi:hypothetical protein